jgi:CBS domain-containing protein
MENGKPVSIITERDIVFKIIAKEKPVSSKVREAMSPKLISIGPDDTIDQAANLMKRHGIKKLPVISYDKLIGIITSTDITAIQPQILDEYRKLLIVNE